jgi:DNA (cytosine-5)-methyltransferase 1
LLHLDLFSGIGGFAHAVDQVWEDAEHIFCDNDPFCQQILKKHWPESEIYDDIRTITDSKCLGQQGQGKDGRSSNTAKNRERQANRAYNADNRPFLLTGGFPCQPFSAAGNRRGTSDDRYLWPEMLRVIQLTKPEWIIAENVGGFVTWNEGLVLETVCTDMEAEGYEVQPFIIPAVAVNAPHRRDRVWIVAHANESRAERKDRTSTNQGRKTSQDRPEGLRQRDRQTRSSRADSADRNVTHTGSEESARLSDSQRQEISETRRATKDSIGQRSRGRSKDRRQVLGRKGSQVQDEGPSWESDWLEAAAEFCSVDDGLPVKLDEFELSKAKHRAEQLKAYGNAIVPAVAMEIMYAIKESEEVLL